MDIITGSNAACVASQRPWHDTQTCLWIHSFRLSHCHVQEQPCVQSLHAGKNTATINFLYPGISLCSNQTMNDVRLLHSHVYPWKDKGAHEKKRSLGIVSTSHPLRGLERHITKLKTHQMERQGQHQEKYPEIEVAGVVEFVLVRVVVPAPGQRCPNPLTQGLHNLGDHLSFSLLLSAQVGRTDDAAAAAARLQCNDLL